MQLGVAVASLVSAAREQDVKRELKIAEGTICNRYPEDSSKDLAPKLGRSPAHRG